MFSNEPVCLASMWSSTFDFQDIRLSNSQTLLADTNLYPCFQNFLSDVGEVSYRRSPVTYDEYCLVPLHSVQCKLYFAEGN
jgi:hypothetical protein